MKNELLGFVKFLDISSLTTVLIRQSLTTVGDAVLIGLKKIHMPNNQMIPEHFNKLGVPKRPFKTQEDAERAAWMNNMICYVCDFCGNWHLANKEA